MAKQIVLVPFKQSATTRSRKYLDPNLMTGGKPIPRPITSNEYVHSKPRDDSLSTK
jgi:hypothetical protein